MNEDSAFVLTGLASRGGLSNWIFFFFPDELVMVDVGMTPAIKAGVLAGVSSQFGAIGVGISRILNYEPKADPKQGFHAWSTELRSKAKNVVELKRDQIRAVRLRMRMAHHELLVTGFERYAPFLV